MVLIFIAMKWKKLTRGSLTLKDGRTFYQGDEFECDEKDISRAFRPTLELIEGEEIGHDYDIVQRKKGWFDVEKDGVRLNDKALRKTDIEDFIKTL